MFRIKQTIQIPKTNKKIKMYLKDTYGAILYFKTKQEAKEQINFMKSCSINKRNLDYKITRKNNDT